MLLRIFVLSVVSFASLVVGCGGNKTSSLTSDEPMTLYSLDPTSDFPRGDKQEPKGETFHGYAVFGKLDVTESAKRKEIAASINKSVADSDGTMNKCFEPRHGIRTGKGSELREYVICFECLQMVVHEGASNQTKAITGDPQPLLNAVLIKAGIKLAPEKWEKR
jgi:hypothetical protein